MTAHQGTDAARFPQGIQLIDEDDAGGLRLRLREEVAHTGRADAHEHLDEVGPAQAEEGHPGFARHRLGQQGFARPGGPDEQHPLGDRAAQPAIVLRALEEIDDFHELGTRLVHAGHTGEGHACGLLHVNLRLALAEAHEPTSRARMCGVPRASPVGGAPPTRWC